MPGSSTPPEGTEIQIIFLTFWDKVTIIAGAFGFILLLSLCMVCILCPQCIFHGLCCDESNDKKKGNRKTGRYNNITFCSL